MPKNTTDPLDYLFAGVRTDVVDKFRAAVRLVDDGKVTQENRAETIRTLQELISRVKVRTEIIVTELTNNIARTKAACSHREHAEKGLGFSALVSLQPDIDERVVKCSICREIVHPDD